MSTEVIKLTPKMLEMVQNPFKLKKLDLRDRQVMFVLLEIVCERCIEINGDLKNIFHIEVPLEVLEETYKNKGWN